MPTGKAKAGTVRAVSACGLILALGTIAGDVYDWEYPLEDRIAAVRSANHEGMLQVRPEGDPRSAHGPAPTTGQSLRIEEASAPATGRTGPDDNKQVATLVYARITSQASRRFADILPFIGNFRSNDADSNLRVELSMAADEVAAANPEIAEFERTSGNLTVGRSRRLGPGRIDVARINAYAWADAAVPGVMACTRPNSDEAKLGSCVDAALTDAGKSLSAATGKAATQRSAPVGERRGGGEKAG